MTQYNIRSLQMMQLEIFNKVEELCEKYNIKYYIIGGTLLGAVRHKGFIPWDDDLDIAMYREDYNKFIKIAKKELANDFFIQNFDTEKHYTRYITKVRMNKTLHIEEEFSHIDMNHGIYIDIFPLDNVLNDSGIFMHLRGLFIRLLFALKTIKEGVEYKKNNSMLKKCIKKGLRILILLIPDKIIKKMFNYVCTLSNNKGGRYTTIFPSGYGWKKQIVLNEVYGEGTPLIFEGKKVNAPSQWHLLLSQVYNDYMQLPPEDKRVSGHTLTKVSFGEYEDYINEK